MNPTIETWQRNPLDVGPLYPLAGWEVPMFFACVIFCVAFMIWKFAVENAQYASKVKRLQKVGELDVILGEYESRE
jgi:hypothetical protein